MRPNHNPNLPRPLQIAYVAKRIRRNPDGRVRLSAVEELDLGKKPPAQHVPGANPIPRAAAALGYGQAGQRFGPPDGVGPARVPVRAAAPQRPVVRVLRQPVPRRRNSYYSDSEDLDDEPKNRLKFYLRVKFCLYLVLVFLAAAGVGGYFLFRHFRGKPSENPSPEETLTTDSAEKRQQAPRVAAEAEKRESEARADAVRREHEDLIAKYGVDAQRRGFEAIAKQRKPAGPASAGSGDCFICARENINLVKFACCGKDSCRECYDRQKDITKKNIWVGGSGGGGASMKGGCPFCKNRAVFDRRLAEISSFNSEGRQSRCQLSSIFLALIACALFLALLCYLFIKRQKPQGEAGPKAGDLC